MALAQAGIGSWVCDLSTGALDWTSGVYELFGLTPAAYLDRREIVTFYEEESREMMERLRARAIDRACPFMMEAQIIRADGERRWMKLNADVVQQYGRTTKLYGLKQDITEEKARWEALRQLAESDPLTGLMNRAVYEKMFLNAVSPQVEKGRSGALVLLDLDGFKQVNDRFGHAAGDACLRVAAQRIASAFADAPIVARIGGDEFAVLADADLSLQELEHRVVGLLADLRQPIEWRGYRLTFGASVGIAPVEDPYHHDPEAMFSIADEALYAAKRAGKGVMMKGRQTGQPANRHA